MPQASAEDEGKGQGSPPSLPKVTERLDQQSVNTFNELSSLRGRTDYLERQQVESSAMNQHLMTQVNMMRGSLQHMAESLRYPVVTTEQSQSSEEEGFRVLNTTNRGGAP